MANREMDRLLEAWRSAERIRDEAEPGSADWERADTEARAMRELYRAHVERLVEVPAAEEPQRDRPAPRPVEPGI